MSEKNEEVTLEMVNALRNRIVELHRQIHYRDNRIYELEQELKVKDEIIRKQVIMLSEKP